MSDYPPTWFYHLFYFVLGLLALGLSVLITWALIALGA